MDADASSLGLIIALFIILFLSNLFSMCETAFVSISKMRAKFLLDEGVKGAKYVHKLVENKEALISTVLIIVNLTAVVFTSISTIVFLELFSYDNEAFAIVFAATFSTIVLLVLGDIFPKVAASKNPEKTALRLAMPMYYCVRVLSPISSFLNMIVNKFLSIFGSKTNETDELMTEEEIVAVINLGAETGVLSEDESQIIDKLLNLKEYTANDIMIPRLDIIAVHIDEDFDEIYNTFKNEHLSRLPVYDEDMDDIIGILNFKDFAFLEKNDFELRKTLREPLFVLDLKSIDSIFMDMKMANASIAIVVDEYGGTAGLITMENLIESILGEIFDEYDDADNDRHIVKISDTEYKAQGTARIDDFNRMVDMELESSDYKSLGGYVLGLFGYIPNSGESILDTQNNLLFSIIDSAQNRIEMLKIELVPKEDKEEKEKNDE